LSPEARTLYLCLKTRAGVNEYVWFSKKNLCDMFGFKKDRFERCCTELINNNYIDIHSRFNEKTKGQETNVIIVYEYDQYTGLSLNGANTDGLKKSIECKLTGTKITFRSKIPMRKNRPPHAEKPTPPCGKTATNKYSSNYDSTTTNTGGCGSETDKTASSVLEEYYRIFHRQPNGEILPMLTDALQTMSVDVVIYALKESALGNAPPRVLKKILTLYKEKEVHTIKDIPQKEHTKQGEQSLQQPTQISAYKSDEEKCPMCRDSHWIKEKGKLMPCPLCNKKEGN
jgi:hypothetical protein